MVSLDVKHRVYLLTLFIERRLNLRTDGSRNCPPTEDEAEICIAQLQRQSMYAVRPYRSQLIEQKQNKGRASAAKSPTLWVVRNQTAN